MKRVVLKAARAQVPDTVDVDVHFKPRYNPWDQRFCVVPDGDLFRALRKGQASIVTDTIETFTRPGSELSSGEHLDADLIVTATGLPGAAPSAASSWSSTASPSTSRRRWPTRR